MERRQSTLNLGTGDSPVRELDKKMENAIEKEYISISQNQSSITTNREEINDLKNRMKNLEELENSKKLSIDSRIMLIMMIGVGYTPQHLQSQQWVPASPLQKEPLGNIQLKNIRR